MITFLEGSLVEKTPTRIVLDVHGVGYEVFIPVSSFDRLPDENAPCKILMHGHWLRQDVHHLYGFVTEAERALFEMLLGISGIGRSIRHGSPTTRWITNWISRSRPSAIPAATIWRCCSIAWAPTPASRP